MEQKITSLDCVWVKNRWEVGWSVKKIKSEKWCLIQQNKHSSFRSPSFYVQADFKDKNILKAGHWNLEYDRGQWVKRKRVLQVGELDFQMWARTWNYRLFRARIVLQKIIPFLKITRSFCFSIWVG